MLSEMMQFLIIIPHHPIMFGLICQNVKISRTEGGWLNLYSPHFVLNPGLVVKAIYVHRFGLNRLEIQE